MSDTIYIGWKRPYEGWIKINSGGGIFHDLCGKWIKGYTKKIETCDVLHVEMWGLYLGIYMAWREHFDHLIFESDHKILIDVIFCQFQVYWEYPYFSSYIVSRSC